MGKDVTNDGETRGSFFRHPLWLLVAGYWAWLIAACARVVCAAFGFVFFVEEDGRG